MIYLRGPDANEFIVITGKEIPEALKRANEATGGGHVSKQFKSISLNVLIVNKTTPNSVHRFIQTFKYIIYKLNRIYEVHKSVKFIKSIKSI